MPLARVISPPICRVGGEFRWPFSIDWAHPDADGLEEFVIATPMGMIDLVSQTVGTRVNTADPGLINELGGLDAYFDGDGDQYTFPNGSGIDSSTDFTLVWECQLSAFVDSTVCVATFYSISGSALRLAYGSGSGGYFWLADGATFLDRMALPSGVSMTDRHFGVWSFKAGLGNTLWINGYECPIGASLVASATTNGRRVGGSSATTNDFNGGIRQVRRYTRAWSQEDAHNFCAPEKRDSLLVGSGHHPYLLFPESVFISGDGVSVAGGSAQITTAYVLAAVGVSVASGTANLIASVPLSAAGASISSGSAGITALVSISAAGLAEAAGQAGLSLGALLFAFGYAQASGNAHISVRDNHIYPDRVTTIRIRGDSNLFVRA